MNIEKKHTNTYRVGVPCVLEGDSRGGGGRLPGRLQLQVQGCHVTAGGAGGHAGDYTQATHLTHFNHSC